MKIVFAKNLRRLCDQKQSYAQICRDIGISQQHLNHYLSGRHMPREEIIKRFSDYFGVETIYFFLDPNIVDISIFESEILSLVRNLKYYGSPPVRDGCYKIFFEIPGKNKLISKGAIFFRNIDGYCTFRRIFINKDKAKDKGIYYGDNFGIAYKINEFIYFAALDKKNRFEPSLLYFETSFEMPNMLVGGGSIVAPFRLLGTKSVVDIGSSKSLRDAVAACGVYHIDELDSSDQAIKKLFR